MKHADKLLCESMAMESGQWEKIPRRTLHSGTYMWNIVSANNNTNTQKAEMRLDRNTSAQDDVLKTLAGAYVSPSLVAISLKDRVFRHYVKNARAWNIALQLTLVHDNSS